MSRLTHTNARLIKQYLALVPAPYKTYERRLILDKSRSMSSHSFTSFLENKIGEADTTVMRDKSKRVSNAGVCV